MTQHVDLVVSHRERCRQLVGVSLRRRDLHSIFVYAKARAMPAVAVCTLIGSGALSLSEVLACGVRLRTQWRRQRTVH